MKIIARISFAFVALTLILIFFAVSIQYMIARKSLENAIFVHLETAAESKVGELALYIRMLKLSAGQLSKSVVIEELLEMPKDDPKRAEAFGRVMTRLARTKEVNSSIFEYMVLDLSGTVVASSDPASVGADKASDSYFTGGQKGVFVKDAYYSEAKKMGLMGVSAPVTDSVTGALRGVLAIRVKLDDLYRITTDGIGMGNTGETFIVNKFGFMITPSRFLKNTFLKQKVDTENIRQCMEHRGRDEKNEKYELVVCPDYRGVPVLATHAYMPEMQWALSAKIDRSEAFAPLRKMRFVMMTLLVLTFLMTWIGSFLLAAAIVRPIDKLRKGVEIIGEGNLDYRVGIQDKDEIGQLSRAFDTMSDNIKQKTVSIESLNKEIVERKAAEDKLAKHEERLSKVARMEAALLDSAPMEEKLKKITDNVVDIFHADFCRVWFIAPGDRCGSGCVHAAVTEGPHVCCFRDRCLHLVASSGRYTHIDGGVHARVPFGCYKIGGIASGEYKDFLTNDVQNDPRVHNHEWAKELGLVSFAGFQLRSPHGETSGVLALFSRQPISAEEFTLLNTISSVVISVIQTSAKEKLVQESEYKFKTLFESSKDAIMMLTPAGIFYDANPATLELFGCRDKKQFTSMGPADLSPEHQPDGKLSAVKAREMIVIAMEKGSNFFEWTHKRVDGKDFYATVLLTGMDIKGERVLQATVRDITEQKEAERAIRQANEDLKRAQASLVDAEKMAALGRFSGGAAHEIKNPLAIILGGAEFLQARLERAPDDAKVVIDKIISAVVRANTIINSLVIFAEPSSVKIEAVSIHTIVSKAVELIGTKFRDRQIHFKLEMGSDMRIAVDSGQILHTIANIFMNAVEAMPVGGQICVRINKVESTDIWKQASACQIEIADNGTGITTDDLSKIFEPFFTTKRDRKQVGLGLTMAKTIIESNNGSIQVASADGKGTTVKISFPLAV